MSVRKVGQRWQVRLRVGSGDRVEQTLPRGATRSDALQLEAKIRRAQIDVTIGRRPRHLIDDAFDRWTASEARNLKSWQSDLRYRVDVLRAYTKDKGLDDLPDVAEVVKKNGQEEGLNPATVNRYLAILRRVGNLAERWGWTEKPIGRRIQLLAERGERHVYFTREQIERLSKAAEPVTADMIRFDVLSGLRLGELLRLKPDNIRGHTVVLDASTKTGRPRAVPIPAQASRIALKRLGEASWGLSKYQARIRLLRASKASGVKIRGWHDLRHTYASWLVQEGKSLRAVQKLLGHSSISTTERYSHLAPEHLEQAVAGLPRLR